MTESNDLEPTPRPWLQADWWLLVALICAAFGLYFQTHKFGFINYDDHLYVSENRRVLSGLSIDNIKWASTAIVVANWHPLTLYTLLLIGTFSKSAGAFHVANAVLHTTVVGLVFVFLRQATGRTYRAAFVAALWGLHPLRVESVAWVSELKDVLCGVFSLLTLIAYTHYSRRRTIGRYGAVVAMFALALLAKPMAVTLPAVLLLLDFWPLQTGKWVARIVDKLPLLAMSVADITYAVVTQKDTASIGTLANFPMSSRVVNAIVSTAAYLHDTIWPTRIGLFYPHPAMLPSPDARPTAAVVAVSLAALLAITAAVVILGRRYRYVPVGWLWFLGMLTPVIGLLQIGEQARADRYTYLPSIGLTIAVVWLVADLCHRASTKKLSAAAGAVAVAALSIVTYVDVGHWENTRTIFVHSAAVIDNNYIAIAERSDVKRADGDLKGALDDGAYGVSIAPKSTAAHLSYGMAFFDAGNYQDAWTQVTRAKDLDPHNPVTWDTLGDVYHKLAIQAGEKKLPKEAEFHKAAITCYEQALKRVPDYFLAEDHLAYELHKIGRDDEALAHWQSVTANFPLAGIAHGHMAEVLKAKKRYPEAMEHYWAAYADGEREPEWETDLAWLTTTNSSVTPDLPVMLKVATDAVDQTGGKNPLALDALAAVLARSVRFDEAAATADKAAAAAGGYPDLAAAIRKRAAMYRAGKPYFVDEK